MKDDLLWQQQVCNTCILHSYIHNYIAYIFCCFNTFDKKINSVVKSGFFYLRLWRRLNLFFLLKIVRRWSTPLCFEAWLVFVCRCCQTTLNHLQLLKNAAARLVTGMRKWDHISPILSSLGWLPVQYRIDLNLWMGSLPLTVRDPTGTQTWSLWDLLTTRFELFRGQSTREAFAVAAPKRWNSSYSK